MTTSNKTTTVESAPQTIDASTLKAWEDNRDDLMVIDVRNGAELDSMHIKGSYRVPLPLLSEHTEEFAAKMGAGVVLVCRPEHVRKDLNGVGPGSASVLASGVPAYAAAGANAAKGRNSWALERQVRMTAGSLVLTTAHQALQNLRAKA